MIGIYLLITAIIMFFLLRNIMVFIFSMENYNIHKKRLQQLKFQRKEEKDLKEIVDTVTQPIITHIFSRIKPKNLEELELDLKMAKWDKSISAIQYRALNLTLKVIGISAGLLLYSQSAIIAGLWTAILFFGMDFLFKNSLNNRKDKLFSEFPDFIRISEGYLSAGLPFTQSITESIKHVSGEWKPILQKFVIECDTKNIPEALEGLKSDVNMFEVREFVALVKLTLEQGGEARDGFEAQAVKIREMQQDIIAIKIGKRQMYGIMLQAPLLLTNLMVFGLPTIASMTSFSSM